jgi:hypothetical protein
VQGVGSGGHLPLAVPDFVWRRCRSHHRQQRGGSHDDERRRAGGVDGREDGGAEEGRVEEDRDEEPRTEQPAGRRPTISSPTTATNHTDTVPRRVEQQLTNLGRTRTGREHWRTSTAGARGALQESVEEKKALGLCGATVPDRARGGV